jgi:hypothetical protein
MSDLETNKNSILNLEPKELLSRILELRTKRRETIVSRAIVRRKKATPSKPKSKPNVKKNLISKLSTTEMLDLLKSLQE